MSQQRALFIYSLVAFWLLATVWAFWWFQFRAIQPWPDHYANFDSRSLAALRLPTSEKPTRVLHLLDRQCPCTRFAVPHIADLEREFNDVTEFYTWPDVPDVVAVFMKELKIPATPAVAIWDAEGKLSYFGPYSSGAICGSGEDLVATTLERLLNNEQATWLSQDVLGCFCAWPENRNNEV